MPDEAKAPALLSGWVEAQAFQDLIVRSLPMALYALEPAGEHAPTWVSDHIEALSGYATHTFLRDADFWAQRVHPDDRDRVIAECRSGLEEQGAYVVEYRWLKADGSVAWFLDRGTLIYDDSGTPVQVVGLWLDITERKHVEAQLRRNQERYRAIVEDQTEMICRFRPDGTLTFVNAAYARNFRQTPDALIGTSFFALVPEKAHADIRRHLQSFSPAESDKGLMEHEVLLPGGMVRWQQWHDRAIYDESGALVEFQSVGRDITEQKEAQETLRRAVERLRFLIEGTPLGCVAYDLDFRITEWNPAAERIFGFSRGEALGRNVFDFLVPRDTWSELRPVTERLRSGETDVRKVNENLTKDGRHITCEWINTPLRDENGAVVGFASMVQDMTERLRAEAAKAQWQEDLQLAQKWESLGLLASGIAHDFNNILSVIVGNAEAAFHDELPPGNPAEHSLRQILLAGHRGKELTRQILTFARGGIEPDLPVPFHQLVRDTMAMLRASVPAQVEVEMIVPDDDCFVDGDPTALAQVIINLVNNACQAMADTGGRLRLELRREEHGGGPVCLRCEVPEGAYVRCVVRDTGPGIPEGIRDRIFDPYFTTKEPARGTGLGLAVARGIVEKHGGIICAEAPPDGGALFWFLLPVSRTRPAPAAAASGPARFEAPQLDGLSVVLVDDDPEVSDVVQRALMRFGCDVRVFGDARAALAWLQTHGESVDLVLSDQAMPGLTGLQLTAAIRGRYPALPVVLCAGNISGVAPEEAERLDVAAVLRKPVNRHELVAAVAHAVRRARLADEAWHAS